MKPYLTTGPSGEMLWFNCDHIMMIADGEDGAIITLSNGNEIQVQEDAEVMIDMIFDMYVAPEEDEEESK